MPYVRVNVLLHSLQEDVLLLNKLIVTSNR